MPLIHTRTGISSPYSNLETNNFTINETHTFDYSRRGLLPEEENDLIEESSSRTRRVDIYRLALRTNSEMLEDLAAIIRILRQINALYRIFHHTNRNDNNNSSGLLRTTNRSDDIGRRMRRRAIYSFIYDDDDDDSDSDNSSIEDDDEASKLLEAGLEDLQAILSADTNSTEQRSNREKHSTLALLSLITYQHNHCSEKYLRHYLNPNGEYDPKLAMFAAAIYDEEDTDNKLPKSCKDIILAAEELYGPNWLEEFHNKGKEGALRRLLEKLTFIAKIRMKVRDSNFPIATR
ncbi:MAG: hypothetical protein EXX96DRAFT_577599 [Benjaminiella poitrasii]|nr:MAG: hypothetical protein EXX96DRAFT_577599 [Benjaminiella poitrasii]